MKLLLLAPQPFYQERGTPIAVDLLLRVWSEMGYTVDVLTYHEGDERAYPGVTIHRATPTPRVRNIRPGFSVKKLICDAALYKKAVAMSKQNTYDIVHAIEESVFMAAKLQRRFGFPYVFDMDSSMPEQMAEKMGWLKPFLGPMRHFESAALRKAVGVVAVCDSLVEIAKKAGATNVQLLNDISLLSVLEPADTQPALPEPFPGCTFMYIGNLESYQGMDLMLESLALATRTNGDMGLVVVGGSKEDIERYEKKASTLGIADNTRFTGPRPINMMGQLFTVADVLVSPRIKGVNTPMKVYSYLDSEKPVLATDLPTHRQVMDPGIAMLAPPEPRPFADAMLKLAHDKALRKQLAIKAKARVSEQYSFDAYRKHLTAFYHSLEKTLDTRHVTTDNSL